MKITREYCLLFVLLMILFLAACGSSSTTDGTGGGGEATPLSIPSDIERNCIGFLTYSDTDFATIHAAGAAWARPHPGPFAWGWIETADGAFDFTRADEIVTAAQNANTAILGTIWPFADWDQSSCHSAALCEVSSEDQFYPGKGGSGIPVSRCAPCSMDDYKEFLSKLIERYDGDGTDDMTGLTIPVKYWEILNEPEMNSDTLTFYKGTQQEYVQILQESSTAIKAACSDCKIVQGGAAGSDSTDVYWGNIFDLGGGNYIDIANTHYIGSGDMSTLNTQSFLNLMSGKGISKPIWVTEVQFIAEEVSEEDVLNSVRGAISAGATKIFYVGLVLGSFSAPEGEYSQVFANSVALCP